jgi:hypothetical protein
VERFRRVKGFWILDFGFWIVDFVGFGWERAVRANSNYSPATINPKSKI